jgi:hypothetical protein
MATNTGTFAELLAPGLYDVMFNEIDMQPNQWLGVVNTNDTQRAYEEDLKVAGLGSMVTKPEGQAVSFDDPIQGNKVRYTPASYGLGFRITREMWDDDLYGIMKQMSAELGRAAAYKIEVDAWSPFNNAFDTAFAGQDGLPLCSTAHTRLDGGTNLSNRPSTGTDISYTGYQAALDHFSQLLDDRGRPIVMTPALLIIDPTWQWAAKEILSSEYKPYTANNEINPLKGEITENGYLKSRYLTSTRRWFVTTQKGQHDVKFWWRVRPETAETDDFLSGDALFKLYCRYARGFSEWRGVYGNPGGS